MSQIIFIIGLQKSGTTLLNRLLSIQPNVANPFKLEGRDFWGDSPPFSPTAEPCGRIYQQYSGEHGHSLDSADFLESDQHLLLERIKVQNISCPIWINKNPYNSVRIPWLKKHFPESKIVAMIRNPLANVFSLLKKYTPHEHMGYPPENGWWGVKPKNWLQIQNQDKLVQSADQWLSVNQEILNQINQVDHLIRYDQLCEQPTEMISELIGIGTNEIQGPGTQEALTCNDQEYLTGSRLLSKNREYLNESSFNLDSQDETIEIHPLKSHEIEMIDLKCSGLWEVFTELIEG